jgi:hypothetical protein
MKCVEREIRQGTNWLFWFPDLIFKRQVKYEGRFYGDKPIEMRKKETMDGLRIKWQCSKLKKKNRPKKNNIHVVSF